MSVLWQEAQESEPFWERAVSWKSFSPRATRSSISGIVAGQIGNRKDAAHSEGAGCVFGGQVERLDGRGAADGGQCGFDAVNAERAGEIRGERGGDGIVNARMGGHAVAGEGERARRIQKRGEVEVEQEEGVVREVELGSEVDAGAVGVAREMIGKAGGLIHRGSAEESFQREENVTTLPVPVEVVEIRIERMIRGELGRVGVVVVGVETDVEADAAIGGFRRDVLEADGGAALSGVHPGDLVGEFEPGAVGAFEGEAAEQKTQPGDRERFAGGVPVAERIKLELLAVENGADVELQRDGGRNVS